MIRRSLHNLTIAPGRCPTAFRSGLGHGERFIGGGVQDRPGSGAFGHERRGGSFELWGGQLGFIIAIFKFPAVCGASGGLPPLSVSQFAPLILLTGREDGAMDHSHYSKVFGLSLAAALGLMLALNALAQSTHSKADGTLEAGHRVLDPR